MKKQFIKSMFIIALTGVVLFQAKGAFADAKRVLPNNDVSLVRNNQIALNLSSSTLTGITVNDDSLVESSGNAVAIKENVPSKIDVARDLCTAQFENVGNINGRQINCTVKVTGFKCNAVIGTGGGGRGLFSVGGGFSITTPPGGNIGSTTQYDFNFVWADTNQTIEFPVFQGIHHLNSGQNSAMSEAIELVDGFVGDFYLWNSSISCIEGNKIIATRASWNYGGSGQEDMWYTHIGALAPSNNGHLRFNAEGWGCGSPLAFFCQYQNISRPEITPNKAEAFQGDTIEWTVNWKTPKLYKDVLTPDEGKISVTIPEGLEFVSVRRLAHGNEPETVPSSSPYDPATGICDCFFVNNSDNLESFYDGTNVTFVITTKVVGEAGSTIRNDATVKIRNGFVSEATSSPVTIAGYSITTSSEGNGVIDGSISKIKRGESRTINYEPGEGSFVSAILIDGVELPQAEVQNHLQSYTFNDIQGDHSINVVFQEFPTLTIRSEMPEVFPEVFGSASSLYKVEGTSYLGDQINLVKHIGVGEEVSFRLVPGSYSVQLIEADKIVSKSITGEGSANNNGSCDLRVGSAKVIFTNSIKDYAGYSFNATEINRLK